MSMRSLEVVFREAAARILDEPRMLHRVPGSNETLETLEDLARRMRDVHDHSDNSDVYTSAEHWLKIAYELGISPFNPRIYVRRRADV